MSVEGAQKQISAAVTQWPDVHMAPHQFGGVEYQLGTREIGHIHGDSLVDIPFPSKVRDELVASGRAVPHHVLPDSGWVSVYLRQPADVATAIALLEQSYQLAQAQAERRKSLKKADYAS